MFLIRAITVGQHWQEYKYMILIKMYNLKQEEEEGNALLNDAHNTFYLWLYDVGHMIKDH